MRVSAVDATPFTAVDSHRPSNKHTGIHMLLGLRSL